MSSSSSGSTAAPRAGWRHRGLMLACCGAVAAVTALAAGCSSNSSGGSGGSGASGGGASSSSQGGGSAGGGSSGGGTKVTATETEFHIALSKHSFKPGTYTFVAVDKGSLSHDLVINGPGVSNAKIQGLLSPGQSGSVTVTLKKGTYDVFCGVPGHKQQGMDVRITVR